MKDILVAIVGAGLIGRSWAITFARAGCKVRLYDPESAALDAAREFIASVGEDLKANGLLGGRTPGDVLDSVTTTVDLSEAVSGAGWVQENGPEKIDIKRAIFGEIEAHAAPEAILASSSSALLPSAIFEAAARPERCLVAHPINPPYLVPAVELVPSDQTSDATMAEAERVMTAVGQSPMVMKREIDGFIVNRLQGALLHEAFRLVAEGYADADDIDRALADGLALRWAFIGPFETIDLNAPGGVADYVARYEGMYAEMFEGMKHRVDWADAVKGGIEAARREHTAASGLNDRQVWRDRRLMALRKHKRDADKDIGR